MKYFQLLLFLLPLVTVLGCHPRITQQSLESGSFNVTLENESPVEQIRHVLLVPSSPLLGVQGMKETSDGLVFPDDCDGIPPLGSYCWSYTITGEEPAHFSVAQALCDSESKHTHSPRPPTNTIPPFPSSRPPHSGPRPTPTRSALESRTKPPPSSTHKPNSSPTHEPTTRPTSSPTHEPTTRPTSAPTHEPTTRPTSAPTHEPTSRPTSAPTHAPTTRPTHSPTTPPTTTPTHAPTTPPTTPTHSPTTAPTTAPTHAPTPKPTSAPTSAPTAPSGYCTGVPRMYQGKPCASTTRYWDGSIGACQCGTSTALPWIGEQYTAAGSPFIYGASYGCGPGCGKCYKLTTTGYSPEGTGAPAGESITIMVTNLCPAGGAWCADGLNSFNYQAHFDLANSPTTPLITELGWDNPEVIYEEVACTGASNSPTLQDFAECVCASS